MTKMERTLGLVAVFSALGMAPVQAQTAKEVVLHTFTKPTGYQSNAGVIRDPAGNLYGTAFIGGAMNRGVVYKLDTARHYTVLYNFTGEADGGLPEAGLIRDSVGNL